jgi:hypothetical protein
MDGARSGHSLETEERTNASASTGCELTSVVPAGCRQPRACSP